jgi:uncharacterized delta-60 repeat protein
MEVAMMPARVRPRRSVMLVVALTVLIATANPGATAPGDLDPTFDGDGKVTTNFLPVDEARGVAIQADGKIVAAGVAICPPCATPFTPHRFAVARYNRDGSLDPTFDGDGKVTTDFDAREDEAFAVAIQGDGKIIAAGSAFGPEAQDFALARYNPDGSLDVTFGGDGMVTSDFAGGNDRARAVIIQPDGKIVAAGVAFSAACLPCDGPASYNFGLARYNPDGSLDPTFGFVGRQVTDFVGGPDEARGVVIQADGKIVAAGVSICDPCVLPVIPVPHDFALVRYNSDGSLDTTFDGDGRVTTDFDRNDDEAWGMALQPDGKIVAAGSATQSSGARLFALARYATNGSLDTAFDGDGKVTTQFSEDDGARAVAIQRDEKIVAAGFTFLVSGQSVFALARYNTNGSLDTIFGGDGRVTTDFGTFDHANAVALQGDGKIVAAGFSDGDFALARYKVCRVSSRRSSIPCR